MGKDGQADRTVSGEPPSNIDYVSRAGLKLHAALDAFAVDVRGLVAADLGCNVGGFVDCLLRRGAEKVYAVDTAYGVLAWTLRKDPRVKVMERTNALHVVLPEAVNFITIDTGWTKQEKILPHARRLLKPGGQMITLIKPHYETPDAKKSKGVLTPAQSASVLEEVVAWINANGFTAKGVIMSPLEGQGGNREYLALIECKTPET